MSLLDIWTKSRTQLEDKQVQQIIAIAGDGHLRDGNIASIEFQEFLAHIPSSFLEAYSEQCLQKGFNESGFALQDIVNEMGRRLGFDVENGRYRGQPGQVGCDGIWRYPDGHCMVIEVKTTDAYRIELNTSAEYRRTLITQGKLDDGSSILYVVGREDTGDLEAQIRGSRYAWDMRVLSVDALTRLMELKEAVGEPGIAQRIHSILIPREFTKLDEIIEIVFSTAEGIKQEDETEVEDEEGKGGRPVPMAFHDACIKVLEKHFDNSLIKRYRVSYSSPDESLAVVCLVSREHKKPGQTFYWFGFYPHHLEFLRGPKVKQGVVALGCTSESTLLVIPVADIAKWLDGMHKTDRPEGMYWHIEIYKEDKKLVLRRQKGIPRVDLTSYLLKKK